ncbi:Plancitoxin-1 [Trichinella spiralis]|uniref:Plancitoxin-1 n=1 Tax=Trichinella spiralis TaxID=6334 RepID=A0A0V1BZ07_TRISP|nr:Plancitoxin-1 [Trichinella spiralis]
MIHMMKKLALLLSLIHCTLYFCAAQTSKCQRADGGGNVDWAILYKPPGQKRGSILIPPGAAWVVYPADLENGAGHSFWKTFESVVGAHNNKKFFAYNNAAPGVVGVKTKSNSKAPADEAAWIVHTVPGYPKPKVAYTFPASEYANGHLLICLTIAESQIEPIALLLSLIHCTLYFCAAQTSKCQQADGAGNVDWAILYKPPGQKRGSLLIPPGAAWEGYPADLDAGAGHSFLKTFESVVGAHNNKKFFAYNNAAPGVVGVKTKSNSKAPADEAAWIVHTVPGYPKPKVAYTFPASEYANGHLLICLTIAESQIEPIAAALLMTSPFIYYNDVPDAEVNTRPSLKKVLSGETALKPPFSAKQNIKTQANPSVPVQIFSKSERSKYEIYQKLISRQLKKTIKVWSRRDKKLKANCKIPGRHILLVSTPIDVNTQASSLEKDATNWLIPENGDIFCTVDKPYAISQKYEPAVAVCIQLANIFARFSTIAAKVNSCS